MSKKTGRNTESSLMNWIMCWHMPKIEVVIAFILLIAAGLWAIIVASAYYSVGMAIAISLIIAAFLATVTYKLFRNIRKI